MGEASEKGKKIQKVERKKKNIYIDEEEEERKKYSYIEDGEIEMKKRKKI